MPKTLTSIVVLSTLTTLFTAPFAFAQTPTDDEDKGENPVEKVETVLVTGRAQQLYRTQETSVGKLPTDPLDASYSVSVINAQLIHDQGARDAQDLYRNISNVSVFSYAGVTARGFRQENIFFDGLRGDPYAGFSVPQLFNIERVEFLKGPASMLYGQSAPGGVFNYVTKRPNDEFMANLTGVLGTEDRLGFSFETTGQLWEGAAGRIGTFYEDRDTPRWQSHSENIISDAALDLDVNFADLLLNITRYEQNLDGNRLRGVPVDDNGEFITHRRWNHNEPDDFLNLLSNNLSAKLESKPSDNFTWDMAIRITDHREEQEYHEPRQLVDSDDDGLFDTVRREFRDQEREVDSISFAANGIWNLNFSSFDNRILIGTDYYDWEYNFDYAVQRYGDVPDLDLHNPVYGLADRSTYNLTVRPTVVQERSRQGYYLMNEASVNQWIFLVGARFDTFEDKTVSTDQHFDDSAVTYRAGAVYKFNEEVSAFFQWADSFEPQSVSNQRPEVGGPFDPTRGDMIELGVKTELYGGRFQSTSSIYEITRSNILQSHPDGDLDGDGEDDFFAHGEVTSRGFETDIAADLNDNWVLTLSYGYNDAIITESNPDGIGIANGVGDRFANAPRNQLGFWTRYQLPEINLAFAIGADYISDRLSLDGQPVNAYTTFDASVIYDPGHYSILLRIDNLTDETYAASGFAARTGHFPGDPRSAFIEFSKKW